ncbi:MAG: M61 family metallopeptidase [Cyclobacteriaceae bacterium]
MKKFICVVLLLVNIFARAQVSAIHYHLSMPEPHTHYFQVSIEYNNPGHDSIHFKMPVWAPGSYLVREFSRNIENFKAYDKDKNLLPVEKTNKNTWQVAAKNQDKVIAEYKVYANEVSVRTSVLNASHGFVSGTSVFMYVDNEIDQPLTLTVEPYTGWEKVSTGLPAVPGKKFTYQADDYDILADSPLEIGNHQVWEFTAAGVPHQVAMYGDGNFNKEKLIEGMSKIVEASTAVFGENPNQKYVFIVHNLDNRGGGLEHLNSTAMQVDRWNYQPENGLLSFFGLTAHEYFHLWLVKRLRPLTLGPFNYEKENYTHLLWVMEGFTSYYDELLLYRTGFYKENQYLNKLVRSINSIENRPGNNVQPVAMASFDAWIKAYRPNENSVNTTISYYTKGSVLAALIDMQVIAASKGEKNLDDVLQYLYNKYYKEMDRGITNAELLAAFEKIAGRQFDEFFEKHVYGTEAIDYQKYFDLVGFKIIDQNEGFGHIDPGFSYEEEGGNVIIKEVLEGFPAYRDGVNAGDELLAIDGYRASSRVLDKILATKQPAEEIRFLIARDGLVKEIKVQLTLSHLVNYKIEPVENASRQQLIAREKWLAK